MEYYFKDTADKTYYFIMFLSPQMMSYGTQAATDSSYFYWTQGVGSWSFSLYQTGEQPKSSYTVKGSESLSDPFKVYATTTDHMSVQSTFVMTSLTMTLPSAGAGIFHEMISVKLAEGSETGAWSSEGTLSRLISNIWIFEDSLDSSKYSVEVTSSNGSWISRKYDSASTETDKGTLIFSLVEHSGETTSTVASITVAETSKEIVPDSLTFDLGGGRSVTATRVGDKHYLSKQGQEYYLIDSPTTANFVDYENNEYFLYKVNSIAAGKNPLGGTGKVSATKIGLAKSKIYSDIKSEIDFRRELDYCNTITPRQLKFCAGTEPGRPNLPGSSRHSWTNIYSVFLREQNTTNELSLIWRQPSGDSIILFEQEYPGTYTLDITKSGYYRITICGGGGGGYSTSHNSRRRRWYGRNTGHNTRTSYTGGASGGVFGIIYIDLEGEQYKTLNIKVGSGSASSGNQSTAEDKTKGASCIEGILSCMGGDNGTGKAAGGKGDIWWEGYEVNSDGTVTQGSIPLLYDTYLYQRVIMKYGEEGLRQFQSGSRTKHALTEDQVALYQGGDGPFLGENIPPKRIGNGVFTNGAGAGLLVSAGQKVGWKQPMAGAGENGYVRIEYIYDENMVR